MIRVCNRHWVVKGSGRHACHRFQKNKPCAAIYCVCLQPKDQGGAVPGGEGRIGSFAGWITSNVLRMTYGCLLTSAHSGEHFYRTKNTRWVCHTDGELAAKVVGVTH